MRVRIPSDEQSVSDGLRDRDSVASTLRGDWQRGFGAAIQMQLIALLADETPLTGETEEGGQPTTVGKLAADALVDLRNLDKIPLVVRTIQKLEKESATETALSNWNELVGTQLYDLSQATETTERLRECLLEVLRRDTTGILTTLIVRGKEEWKYSLGCRGLKYRNMSSDVEELLEVLRDAKSEHQGRVVAALKEVTGQSFLFGASSPVKWAKWLKANRDQFIE